MVSILGLETRDKYIDFKMMFIFLFVLSLRFEAKEFLILNIEGGLWLYFQSS